MSTRSGDGKTLLSDWNSELKFTIGKLPKALPLEFLANLKQIDFVGYATRNTIGAPPPRRRVPIPTLPLHYNVAPTTSSSFSASAPSFSPNRLAPALAPSSASSSPSRPLGVPSAPSATSTLSSSSSSSSALDSKAQEVPKPSSSLLEAEQQDLLKQAIDQIERNESEAKKAKRPPKHYRRLAINYQRLGMEDFDFRYPHYLPFFPLLEPFSETLFPLSPFLQLFQQDKVWRSREWISSFFTHQPCYSSSLFPSSTSSSLF
jgi:hypothetical protein